MAADWDSTTLGEVASLRRGLAYVAAQLRRPGRSFVTIKCFEKGGGFRVDGLKTYAGPVPPEFEVSGGELLIANTDLTRDASIVGAPALVPPVQGPAAVFSMDVSRLVTDASRADNRFLAYRLAAHDARSFMQARSGGSTVLHLHLRAVPHLSFRLPPLPEQRQIAEILDTLDEAIRKTEQIIAKLQQVKQGLLHDLLTRGIDDNGELRDPDRHPEQFKDSPLGRIPKDWVVAPLSHWNIGFIDGDRGTEYPSEADFFPEGHCLFLSAKNVTKTGFRFEEVAFISQSKHTRLRNGALVREDIVVTTRGTLGNFAYFDETVPYQFLRINSGMVIIRAADARLSVPYLFETLCSPIVQRQITTYAYGSAQPQLNLDILRGLLVAVPPQAEQSLLVDRLSAVRHRERSTTGELAKLRLLKSGLMEDLLTGRVRVTKLPEQAAE